MSKDSNILSQLKLREKPLVPLSFFKGFINDLENDLYVDKTDVFELSHLKKNKIKNDLKTNLEVFSNEIIDKVSPVKIKKLKWLGLVAASILIAFGITFFNNNKSVIQAESGLALFEQEEIILSYLSENDIIDYLTETDFDLNDAELIESVLIDEMNFDIDEYNNEL